jgi:hypothetical protein
VRRRPFWPARANLTAAEKKLKIVCRRMNVSAGQSLELVEQLQWDKAEGFVRPEESRDPTGPSNHANAGHQTGHLSDHPRAGELPLWASRIDLRWAKRRRAGYNSTKGRRMPIPAFDTILNILPPHLGDPREPAHLSPYVCTVEELCDRFATSAPRKNILEGFLNLRGDMSALGIQGFQWLDGSFLEDIESQEGRSPNDIDVVSFISAPHIPIDLFAIIGPRPELWKPAQTKAKYSVDHYFVPLGSDPSLLIDTAKYWYGLFSHRRADGAWKGMATVDLVHPANDAAARMLLASRP